MFKSENSNATNHSLGNSSFNALSEFWNNTIFAHITEKYMEFDLNDKGEIGKAAVPDQLLLSVVTH